MEGKTWDRSIGRFPFVFSLYATCARAVYATLGGKPRRVWLRADFLNGFNSGFHRVRAQETKRSDRDDDGGKLFLNQARDHIGLILSQQMAGLPVGIGEHWHHTSPSDPLRS